MKASTAFLLIACLAVLSLHGQNAPIATNAPAKSRDLPDPEFDVDVVEASLNQHYNQLYRPQIHFTAIQGHIGDATGLIYERGEYHLFYMFDKWERRRNRHKTWGYATSTDCIHWEEKAPILDPIIDHKPGSGGGIVDWNNTLGLRKGPHKTLVVFYTDYATGSCISYSTDGGQKWTRHPRNPVLGGVKDMRDPIVFWYKPAAEWRMVRYETQGFAFYGSSNLLDWTYLSRIEGFYECPDFFELPVLGSNGDSKWVLMGAGSKYLLGSFDGRKFTPETEMLKVEHASSLYAPQTWKQTHEGGGPLIQMGFLRYPLEPRLTWHNQMTFPCELTLRKLPEGVRLCRMPTAELKNLRVTEQVWRDVKVSPGQNTLSSVKGDVFEIKAEIDIGSASGFTLGVRDQTLSYSAKDQSLTFARTTVPLKTTDNRVRFQIIVDRSSVEVFIDQGQANISKTIFFSPDRMDYSLIAEGGEIHVISLEANRLESIWKN